MSIARACYVMCDRCGDPAPVEAIFGAKGAREQARGHGFVRVNGEDLCRKCKPKTEDPAVRDLPTYGGEYG